MDRIIANTGLWVWVIIALVALWFLAFVPAKIKNHALEKQWKCADFLDKYIVIIEIAWIALLLYLGRFIKL